MKKIIKKGNKPLYRETCGRCGCEFSFQEEDIETVGTCNDKPFLIDTSCPQCGGIVSVYLTEERYCVHGKRYAFHYITHEQ